MTHCLSQYKFQEQQIAEIVLAIDEAAANAIIHGNNCDDTMEITIDIEYNDQLLEVEISDIGYFKVPNNQGSIDVQRQIDKEKNGGLGMKIIYNIMDEVLYRTVDNQFKCILKKYMNQTK